MEAFGTQHFFERAVASALASRFETSPGKNLDGEAEPKPEPEVIPERRFSITLSVDEAGMEVLKRVQEILSQSSGRVPTMEEVVLATGEEFLSRKAPEKREERRAARAA